jgi:hypothetical protein
MKGMIMYEKELAMVEHRWLLKENLKRIVFHDLRAITILIVLTMAIPKASLLAMGLQIGTLLILISFAKWLIK